MINYANLAREFDVFERRFEESSRRNGGSFRSSTRVQSDESDLSGTLMLLRRHMVQLEGVWRVRRTVNSANPNRWPITPMATCNIGFRISEDGHVLLYQTQTNPCGCLAGHQEFPDRLSALTPLADGTYARIFGEPIYKASGGILHLGNSNAVLCQFDFSSVPAFPQLPIDDDITKEEEVFALGTNQNHWIVSQGMSIPSRSDASNIITTVECFHGFCGAPLINRSGSLQGFGATIKYKGEDQYGVPNRAYGMSSFDRISHLLDY